MSNNANPSDGNGGSIISENWRASIAQSSRSEEVRSIAEVLASLEPGATSASKTMLAMRFEDTIFHSASSYDDYRKTIQKRIKRLQKHYVNKQNTDGNVEDASLTREKELLLERELRDIYGARLMYVTMHGDEAIKITREKYGDKKADTLQAHVANAKMWVGCLGMKLPNGETCPPIKVDAGGRMAQLTSLQGHLESRLANIRSFIIQIYDKDLFVEEAYLKLVDDILLKNENGGRLLRDALLKADPDDADFSENKMTQLIERMKAPLPIPRRNQKGDRLRVAVVRVEKIRASVQAFYIYMGLPIADKARFRHSLEKCFAVVKECLNELDEDYKSLVKEAEERGNDGNRIIQLEDAWNNPLEFLELESDEPEPMEPHASEGDEPDSKRQKSDSEAKAKARAAPMVIRSKILLTPERNTLSSLLPALKRKRANLIRKGNLNVVHLEFDNAFEMTIYFVPLIVTIRAISSNDVAQYGNSSHSTGGLYWPSLYQGLQTTDYSGSSRNATQSQEETNLTVLGVTGSYETLGSIIAPKLEYASAQATYVLRRCFAESTVNQSSRILSDFEIEILEVGALIKFLRIARTTYMPDWVDDEP